MVSATMPRFLAASSFWRGRLDLGRESVPVEVTVCRFQNGVPAGPIGRRRDHHCAVLGEECRQDFMSSGHRGDPDRGQGISRRQHVTTHDHPHVYINIRRARSFAPIV